MRNRVKRQAGMLTIVVTIFGTVNAWVLPDFNKDQDLEAWHQFGQQSFYGPWGVVSRKPNGDLVSYADYGAPIPSDFQATSENDVSSDKEKPDSYPLEIFADPSTIALDLPGLGSQRNAESDEAADRSIESPSRDQLWRGRNQRDTLELIGIVGVIENVETSSSSEESASEKSERSNVADSVDQSQNR